MPDELFDVVNEEDVVIGQELRSIVHQRGLWHRGVHVLLFTREGKLLVQQRSKNRPHAPLALDCSVSEHVKAGEDYLTAAMRGMKEEMNVEGALKRPSVASFSLCRSMISCSRYAVSSSRRFRCSQSTWTLSWKI